MEIERKKDNYEKMIESLTKYRKIITKESCLTIMAYLNIYGKLNSKELVNKTGLGRGSVFRSLNLLIEADLIERKEDPRISDKRKNTHYYLKNDEITLNADEGFKNYLKKTNKYELYENWIENANNYHSIMLKVSSSIFLMEKGIKASEIPNKGRKRFQMRASDIISLEDTDLLFSMFEDCVKKLDEIQKSDKRDFTKPLSDPVYVSLAMIKF